MLFVAAAVVGAMLAAFGDEPAAFAASPTFRFARAVSVSLVNVYMVKMAGVFMISTSTVAMSTRFAPRWLAGLGYLLAALLLIGSSFLRWSFALFPLVGAVAEHPDPGARCWPEVERREAEASRLGLRRRRMARWGSVSSHLAVRLSRSTIPKSTLSWLTKKADSQLPGRPWLTLAIDVLSQMVTGFRSLDVRALEAIVRLRMFWRQPSILQSAPASSEAPCPKCWGEPSADRDSTGVCQQFAGGAVGRDRFRPDDARRDVP